MPSYVALLTKVEDAGFTAHFPDFPECTATVANIEELRSMATETLALHVLTMANEGRRAPRPSALDTVLADPANLGDVIMSVWVPDPAAKHVRINATLPHDLLAEIDRSARHRGISRSELLARGAEMAMIEE